MTWSELQDEWLVQASIFRDHAQESIARTYEHCAEGLRNVLDSLDEVPLTVSEAAAESGYSEDHLRRRVRQGRIPNAGRPGAPRIARRHLPTKPGFASPVAQLHARRDTSNRQIVQSIIDKGVA